MECPDVGFSSDLLSEIPFSQALASQPWQLLMPLPLLRQVFPLGNKWVLIGSLL
eukprot:SAG31_NODE_7145_length_1777_cov_1.325983_1_plen_53_part_10